MDAQVTVRGCCGGRPVVNIIFVIMFIIDASVKGSPFLQKQAASQFIDTRQDGSVRRMRRAASRGYAELEGWQEILTFSKRGQIPTLSRQRTISQLQRVSQLTRQITEGVTELEVALRSLGLTKNARRGIEMNALYKGDQERWRGGDKEIAEEKYRNQREHAFSDEWFKQ